MLNKIIYVVLGLSLGLALIPKQTKNVFPASEPTVLGTSIEREGNTGSISPEMAQTFAPPEVFAKAVFAFDFSSDTILFTRNFEEPLPIASLTKLMTALLVRKNLSLDRVIEVVPEDLAVVGNKMGLLPKEKISVAELLHGMLISSSNDAARVLARASHGSIEQFVAAMNEEGKKLKLTSTYFTDVTGLDSNQAYSTAFDLSLVVKAFVADKYLSGIVAQSQHVAYSADGKVEHNLTTTNKLLLDNPSVIGIKTGYTSKALGNLIIRTKLERADVVTIVLGSENREEDSQKLIDWIFFSYRW